jgi:riboflavin kinase
MAERAKIAASQQSNANGDTQTFPEVLASMNTLTLNGKVISGQGSGKKYLGLPWVKSQIEEKLGFEAYTGTLNLQLSEASVKRRKLLNDAESIEISPAEDYCVGFVFKARIDQTDCAVVLPQVEGYPRNLLEIIAPVNLRKQLRLEDGDEVEVTVRF